MRAAEVTLLGGMVAQYLSDGALVDSITRLAAAHRFGLVQIWQRIDAQFKSEMLRGSRSISPRWLLSLDQQETVVHALF
jgi:hypothetical protein